MLTRKYFELNVPYQVHTVAYLMAEGVGINGGYTLKGYIVVRGRKLSITCRGYTPAARAGSVFFHASAEMCLGHKPLAKVPVKHSHGLSYWPNDEYTNIGTAEHLLPTEPADNTPVILLLEGGYTFSSGHGSAVPLPFQVKKEFTLQHYFEAPSGLPTA